MFLIHSQYMHEANKKYKKTRVKLTSSRQRLF